MLTIPRFTDRYDAGRRLGLVLRDRVPDGPVIVLGLPRGGVPVAARVAEELDAPFDVFIVRKLGMPGHEECALGAIASGGVRVLNEDVIDTLHISPQTLERIVDIEYDELRRREFEYRGRRPFPDLAGKTVIVVDDGAATGASMRAAVLALRKFKPASIIVANWRVNITKSANPTRPPLVFPFFPTFS
jgi:predicted phosphoribosyltransferase